MDETNLGGRRTRFCRITEEEGGRSALPSGALRLDSVSVVYLFRLNTSAIRFCCSRDTLINACC